MIAIEVQTRRRPAQHYIPVFILAVLASISAIQLFRLGAGTSFYYDEWNFILYRRGVTLPNMLEPHQGHLSLLPVLAYNLLFSAFGLTTYVPYRLLIIGMHIILCALLFIYAARRVGQFPALIASALLLFCGAAWENMLWPFQIGFVGALASGLTAMIFLDRNSTRASVAASICLGVSFACAGVALALAAAVSARLICIRAWSRWWVVGIPAALFAAWYLIYGERSEPFSPFADIPPYVAKSAAAAAAGIISAPLSWGTYVMAILGVLICIRLVRRPKQTPCGLVSCIAFLAVFWGLTGLARAVVNEPAASRYIYAGALGLLLVCVECVHGLQIRPGPLLVAAASTLVAIGAGQQDLRAGASGLTQTATYVRAELTALEMARFAPSYQPDPVRMPQVTAGPYLAAVAELGSPALPRQALRRQPEGVRQAVDAVLVPSLLIERRTGPETVGIGSPVWTAAHGVARNDGSCVTFDAYRGESPPVLSIVVPPFGVSVHALTEPSSVRFRRYADAARGSPAISVNAGSAVAIKPRSDTDSPPWRAEVTTEARVVACTLASA